MARHNREAGTLKLCILSAALSCGVALPALPANAQDNKLALSASAALTTDYVFRGITQTASNPAFQPEFDATYGMFYAGVWGSNLDWGGGPNGQDLAPLELDWYFGITPTWQGISFNIGGIYYDYPGSCTSDCGLSSPNYWEIKTGASYTFFKQLTLGVTNYYSPEFSGNTGTANALELSSEYDFQNKLFNFFSPSVSGLVGWQYIEKGDSYTYWNAGLTLAFLDHWSADVRYWDTNGYAIGGSGVFSGGSRVVGTLKASF